jgi:hypothetical protein
MLTNNQYRGDAAVYVPLYETGHSTATPFNKNRKTKIGQINLV